MVPAMPRAGWPERRTWSTSGFRPTEGIGGALRAGFRHACSHGYDRAVQFDADGQHRADQVERLLVALDGGADLAIGNRYVAGGYRMGLVRRLSVALLRLEVRVICGEPFQDITSGFRAVDQPLLTAFAERYPDHYLDSPFIMVAAHRAGYRVTEVPTQMHQRTGGEPSVVGVALGRRLSARRGGSRLQVTRHSGGCTPRGCLHHLTRVAVKSPGWSLHLKLIFCFALVPRWFVAHALTACPTSPPDTWRCFSHDGFYYYSQGRLIGDGHFFKNGWIFERHGELVDSALHPPGFSLLLGAWSALGLDSLAQQKTLLSLLGAMTAVAVAVLVRQIGGERAGVAAGWLAAAYPPLWLSSGLFTPESLYYPAMLLVLVAAYAYVDQPTIRRVALLGVSVGAAALVRGEAVLLWIFLLVPLVWTTACPSARERCWLLPAWVLPGKRAMFHLLAGSVAALVAVSPWVAYLNATFNETALLTTAPGRVLVQGSCDSAWHGERTGYVGSSRLCFDDLDLSARLEAEVPWRGGRRRVGFRCP